MAFIITTTGTPGTVIINDLGEKTFVHPIISYDLEAEYSSFELSQSSDLQAAITGGEITAVDGSGNSITIVSQLMDLQAAYNSSINPEIITDATLGSVTIKRGSAADTDNVLETQDGAGSNTFEVTGAGKVTGTDFNDVSLTTGGVATNYLNETGTYSAPSGGTGTVTSITPAADSGSGTAITTSGTLTTDGGKRITSSVSGTTTTVDWDGLVVQKDGVNIQTDTGGINFKGTAITSVNTPGGTLPTLEVTIDEGETYYSQNLIDITGCASVDCITGSFGSPSILVGSSNFYITVAETGTYIIYGTVNISNDLNKDNDALELIYGIDPLGVGSPVIGPAPYQQNLQAKKKKRNGIQGTWLGVGLTAGDRVHMYMSTCGDPCTWLGGRIFIAQWK